jgi:Protein of unknown function (DUF2490)
LKRLGIPIRFLVFALAAPAWAAELETQHGFDATLPLKADLDLVLHARIRTQPSGLGLYQIRTGPIVSWKATPRFAPIAGYYFSQQESREREFLSGSRIFGGAESALARKKKATLDGRIVFERFLPGGSPDFNRYRLRTRLSANSTVAPYAAQELFLDAKGWRSTRLSTGVRWSLSRSFQVDAGYLYEFRRLDIGGNRQIFLTSIQFKRSAAATSDPDL